jgi:hypothetical protein
MPPDGMRTMNMQELYEQTIKSLPASERLRLAVLILNDIPPQSVVDASESWTEEDLQEFTQGSWAYIDQRVEDEEHA